MSNNKNNGKEKIDLDELMDIIELLKVLDSYEKREFMGYVNGARLVKDSRRITA